MPETMQARFYIIDARPDGSADVYLFLPEKEIRIVRGVIPWEGMEEDIRTRYDAWCASAETIMKGLHNNGLD